MRQRWDEILRAEGLGEIDFATNTVTSSAVYHQLRIDKNKHHFRSAELLDSIREILAEYRVPPEHRRMMRAYLSGQSLRQIAEHAGISKDTVHRIILRYVGANGFATTAELSNLGAEVRLDARRTKIPTSSKAKAERPLSSSDTVQAYFELARAFAASFVFLWHRDRDIWDLHLHGMPRRKIARELGLPDTTVQRALERVRRGFKQWLASREREETDHAHISAMFECFSQHERE